MMRAAPVSNVPSLIVLVIVAAACASTAPPPVAPGLATAPPVTAPAEAVTPVVTERVTLDDGRDVTIRYHFDADAVRALGPRGSWRGALSYGNPLRFRAAPGAACAG